jgi:pimeloyl-ACP methyl ester carboxylesterase
MQTISGFDFFSLTFDENGKLTSSAELGSLKARAARASAVIFLSHGFRNSTDDATNLYTQFLTNFRAHFTRPECQILGGCDFAVAGVYWPSLALPETFPSLEGSTQSLDEDSPLIGVLTQKLNDLKDLAPGFEPQLNQAIQLLPSLETDGGAQNNFTDLVLAVIKDPVPDPTEGFDALRDQDGAVILQKLSAPVILPTAPADASPDSGGVLSLDDSGGGSTEGFASTLGSILGGADRFVNLASWWIMKNRCGVVGTTGVAQAVRELAASKPGLPIHLVGHSLGGRLMAACAKSLAQNPLYQPASVTLLEAAFSHFGFSANNGQGTPGFFRDVIAKKVTKGPLIATFSAQDTVVGTTYALASRLAGDNVKAIGDANDPFGGIGRNGAIKTTESTVGKLKKAGAPDGAYQFQLGVVNCLDGSGGLIKDHSDVTNPDVTYAFACSVASTQAGSAASGGGA